jgi:WD40 repeat protein
MAVLPRAWFLALFTLDFFCVPAGFAQQPELVIQTGHSMSVLSLAFSPDGKTLASGSVDKTIKIWDVANGRAVRTLAGHANGIESVVFSPEGHTLASVDDKGEIKLWDVTNGRELQTLRGYSPLMFSIDGHTLTSAADKGTVQVWDVANGQKLRTVAGPTDKVGPAAFSPDGHTLALLGDDKAIRLWNMASGQRLRTLTGHIDTVRFVAFSPDGRTLASASSDKTIKLWDVTNGRELRTLTGHTNTVRFVVFSPDGRTLASGSSDATVKLWDVDSGRELRTLTGHTMRVGCVAFGPDGHALASGSDDTTIKLWDVGSGRELRMLAGQSVDVWSPLLGVLLIGGGLVTPTGHSKAVRSLALSPEGHTLAARGGDQTIKLWDLTSRRGPQTPPGETGSGASVAVSPDGRDLTIHYELKEMKGNLNRGDVNVVSGRVGPVAFSPDGSTLAWGSSLEAKIKIWDLGGGRELRTLTGHRDSVWSVAFSPDQHSLASGGWNGEVKLWDSASGRELQTLAGHTKRVQSVAFSPNAKKLASASDDRTIKLWDVASGHELLTLAADGQVAIVAFSPDGQTLASATEHTIKLWDVASGHEVRTLAGNGPVETVAFRPNGQLLAAGSHDNMIEVWDVVSGRKLQTLTPILSPVLSLCFSSDGSVIVSGHENGEVRFWDVSADKELAALFALDENNWVVSDAEGRFDTNNLDEIKGLSWVFPEEPLRALAPEIFMRDYYQPKLLRKVLAGERLPAVRRLSDLNRAQPEVEVLKVQPEAGEDLVSVTVKVTSTRSEVQKDKNGKNLESGAFDLYLLRDGQFVGQWPDVSETAERPSGAAGTKDELESWRKLREIKLVSGEYTHTFGHVRLPHRAGLGKVQFTAYAFNSDRVKSLTTPPLEYLLPKPSASSSAAVARRAYLISMGVNANQSRWNLSFAVASAQDTARLLHEKLVREYEVVDISLFSTLAPDSPQVLLQQATKSNLKAVLDLLAGRSVDNAMRAAVDPNHRIQLATPDDAVVLFISSHGYADPQGTFYVVPYDTGSALGVTEDSLNRCQAHPEDRSPACQKAGAFLERTISSQEFGAWWTGVDAGEMVMILDSCHSAAVPGREFRPGPLGDAGFGQLSYDKGMRILSATQPDKTARATLVQELGHSLLVEALIEEAKAHPQETLAQWLHDTEQQVPELTHRLYPELSDTDVQLPELFDFGVRERQQALAHSPDVSE